MDNAFFFQLLHLSLELLKKIEVEEKLIGSSVSQLVAAGRTVGPSVETLSQDTGAQELGSSLPEARSMHGLTVLFSLFALSPSDALIVRSAVKYLSSWISTYFI